MRWLACTVVAVCLAGCGGGTEAVEPSECGCPDPAEVPDSFDAWEFLYGDCVDLCEIANKWADGCRVLRRTPDECVRWLWDRLTEPIECQFAIACYELMLADGQHCDGEGDEWVPNLFWRGCPY